MSPERDERPREPRLGRHHPLLRRLRALRRDRSLRRAERLFLAEGPRLAREALEAGAGIREVVVSPRLGATLAGRDLLDALERRGLAWRETEDDRLRALLDPRSPQPIVCLVEMREPSPAEIERVLGRPSLVVVAHGVQDPGNLGAILRTAAAAGSDLLLATGSCADPYHPRAVRASAGAIFRLPVADAAIEPLLDRLGASGYLRVAADPRGGNPFDQVDLRGALALVLGSEGSGLPQALAARIDETVRIPLRRGVESLSVGAAAAVLLFEAARQRARSS